MRRPIRILHAPSPLGLEPPADGRVPGVRFMPEALRAAGLHDALGAEFAGAVAPPAYSADRDPENGLRNRQAVASYAEDLADAVSPMLDVAGFPLILGGDCSIMIGVATALRRHGRYGLVYIDGHSDCQTPEISRTGGLAGMPLAFVTGHLPGLVDLEDAPPFVDDADAVLVGCRDLFDIEGDEERHVVNTGIRVRDLGEMRRMGPSIVARDVVGQLTAAGVDGLWVHLDVDVLDPAIMPAVDSPDPGGLTAAELVDLLRPLAQSSMLAGMHVTIYDPERDEDGRAAAMLVRVLFDSLDGRRDPSLR